MTFFQNEHKTIKGRSKHLYTNANLTDTVFHKTTFVNCKFGSNLLTTATFNQADFSDSSLNLNGNETIENFSFLKDLTNLATFYLTKSNFNEKQLNFLKQELPQLNIVEE